MTQARFWHWYTSTGALAAILGFAQYRFDLLGQVATASNAPFIYGIAIMGALVSLRLGIAAFGAARGRDIPDLAVSRYLAVSAPLLGLIGTVMGLKDALLHGIPSGPDTSVQAVLSAFAGPVGMTLWSTATGAAVCFFLGLQHVMLTGGRDG